MLGRNHADKFQGVEIGPFPPPSFTSGYFSLHVISFATPNTVCLFYKEPKKKFPTNPAQLRIALKHHRDSVNHIFTISVVFLILLECTLERAKIHQLAI